MPSWDYGANGLYYITICTKDRINHFGEIVSEDDQKAQIQRRKILRLYGKTAIGEIGTW